MFDVFLFQTFWKTAKKKKHWEKLLQLRKGLAKDNSWSDGSLGISLQQIISKTKPRRLHLRRLLFFSSANCSENNLV